MAAAAEAEALTWALEEALSALLTWESATAREKVTATARPLATGPSSGSANPAPCQRFVTSATHSESPAQLQPTELVLGTQR